MEINRQTRRNRRSLLAYPLCALLFAISFSVAHAQEIGGYADLIEVPLNKSKIVKLHTPIKKVSMGNPNIADIVVLRGQQIYILGKQLGTTNVTMWDKNNNLVKTLDIAVHHDLNTLKEKLALFLPDERVEVHSSQGAIVLSGQVSSLADMDSALMIARSFVRSAVDQLESQSTADKESDGGSGADEKDVDSNIINLMTIGGSQQVMLKVTVAELSRTTAKKLGVKFNAAGSSGNWTMGGVNGGATFPDTLFPPNDVTIPIFDQAPIIGPMIKSFLPNDLGISDKGIFASFLNDDFLFSMSIEAAKENGTAKILAEPTLTAMSGEEASFLSGGEFPIPVPRGDDGITVEFKEFGVGVKFMPVVLSSGAINLTINVSVTEINDVNSIAINAEGSSSNFFVPSLSNRSTSTTIELADGQTIGIAGLISENMRSVVSKFPGLGDLPILGVLFRDQAFEKGESELVIMVTPYLAQPINNKLVSLPTDNFVEPSDMEFYLLGKTYGKVGKGEQSGDAMILSEAPESFIETDSGLSGGVEGKFGHSIE